MSIDNGRRKFMSRAGAVGIAGVLGGAAVTGTAAAEKDASVIGVINVHNEQDSITGATVTVDGPTSTEEELDETWYAIDVEAGDYDITVDAEGYHSQTKSASVESDERVQTDFDLEPKNAGTLEGTLLDQDGNPVESEFPSINLDGPNSLDISAGSNGEYEINLSEDLWVFEPDVLGYDGEREIVEITEGETTTFNPELESNKEGRLSLYLFADDEQPKTTVLLDGPDQKDITTEEGQGSIEVALEEGQYIVEATPEGGETQITAIEITHGEETIDDFVLDE